MTAPLFRHLCSFDRRISSVIQHMSLGRIGDFALMIPGSVCGVPEACTSVLLAAVPLLVEPCVVRMCIFLPQAVAYVFVFRAVVLYGTLSERWLVSPAMLPEVVINLMLTWQLTPWLLEAQLFFLLSTVLTLLMTSTLKTAACRLRPAIAEQSTGLPERAVNFVRFYVAPTEAYKSFPSADAAEAAVFFGAVAVARGGGSAFLWLLGMLVPCFGRIYFHAHYFLDVVAGSCIGLVSIYFVSAFLHIAGRQASIWDMFPAVIGFAIIKHFVKRPAAGDLRFKNNFINDSDNNLGKRPRRVSTS